MLSRHSGGPFGLPMGLLGGRRRAGQARGTQGSGALGTAGIGSVVLVMFVIMGAIRWVWSDPSKDDA